MNGKCVTMAVGGSEASRKCEGGCAGKWEGGWLDGCYSVYITQTFTVISLIDHALYTHIIKTLNIIIVWTKSVKVALFSKGELGEKSIVEVRGCRNIHLHLPRTVSQSIAVLLYVIEGALPCCTRPQLTHCRRDLQTL